MAKTVLDLTNEERALYQPLRAIEERQASAKEQIQLRWRNAQELAHTAAEILRSDYEATRVVLFGSATRPTTFTLWSDVDLAAWGIPDDKFYAAVAAVSGLSRKIGIDLVDPESCSPALREAIDRDGTEM
jgi:uncharacterized protein